MSKWRSNNASAQQIKQRHPGQFFPRKRTVWHICTISWCMSRNSYTRNIFIWWIHFSVHMPYCYFCCVRSVWFHCKCSIHSSVPSRWLKQARFEFVAVALFLCKSVCDMKHICCPWPQILKDGFSINEVRNNGFPSYVPLHVVNIEYLERRLQFFGVDTESLAYKCV